MLPLSHTGRSQMAAPSLDLQRQENPHSLQASFQLGKIVLIEGIGQSTHQLIRLP